MSPSTTGPRRRLMLPILLLAMVGLLTLLYFQRQQIPPQQAANALPEKVQVELPLDADKHFKRLYEEAKAAHRKFEAAFGGNRGQRTAKITSHPNATTAAKAAEQFRLYYLRDLDRYLAHTKDQGAARDAGATFIKAAVPASMGLKGNLTADELSQLAETIWTSNTADPLLRSLAANWLAPLEDTVEVAKKVELGLVKALGELPRTPYSASVEVGLRFVLYRRAGALAGVNQRQRQTEMNLALVKWLKEESPTPEWHRCVYSRLTDILPLPERGPVLAMAAAEPDIAPWFLHTLAGHYYRESAWAARGKGYANTVTPEGWKTFATDSEKAMVHFRYAWLLHPEFPIVSASMIAIAYSNNEGGRTATDWFHKLLEAQVDYELGYHNYMFSLLTRWGGSEKQMFKFARECLETNRFDTIVPDYVFTIIRNFEHYEKRPENTLLATVPVAKELVDAYCRQRVQWVKDHAGREEPYDGKIFPERVFQLYMENKFLNEARGVAQATPADYNSDGIWEKSRLGHFDWDKLRGSTDDVRDLIDRLDKQLRLDHTATLTPAVQEQLKADVQQLEKLAATDSAEIMLRHFQAMFRHRLAFSSGEWVELLNGPDKSGYDFYASRVRYDEASKSWELQGDSDYSRAVRIELLAGIAPPFEVELQAGLAPSTTPGYSSVSAGVAWSPPEGTPEEVDKELKHRPFLAFFGLQPMPTAMGVNLVKACFPWRNRQIGRSEMSKVDWVGPTERLHLKLWPGAFEYRLRQLAVTEQIILPSRTSGFVTFGELAGYKNHTYHQVNFRVGGVRIRRLASAPIPVDAAPVEERTAYWQTRHQADPQDAVPLRELARSLVKSDPARAVTLARQALELQPLMNGVHCALGLALKELGQLEEAERELSIAGREEPHEVVSNATLVEMCLAHPNPEQEQYNQAEMWAMNIEAYGNPCLSATLQARLAYAQKKFSKAVSLNSEALKFASEAELSELKALQQKYEAALPTRKPQPPR